MVDDFSLRGGETAHMELTLTLLKKSAKLNRIKFESNTKKISQATTKPRKY